MLRLGSAYVRRCFVFLKVVALIVLAGIVLAPLSATVFWQGYYQSKDGPSFALSRTPNGAGVWRTLGQQFDQYQLISFDREKEHLVLERNGDQTVLKLSEVGHSRLTRAQPLNAMRAPSLAITVGGHTSFAVVPELQALAQLRKRLRAMAALAPDSEVEIESRGDPPVAWILAATNACQDAGFKRITFKTIR
ncbi:MAG TPA: hypothetical protein PLN52_18125 [Opitutaceae bacterium]|nr:hypothetical protein [Opitutaceae bacterium]